MPPPIFAKGLSGCLLVAALSGLLALRAGKERHDFLQTTGPITYLSSLRPGDPEERRQRFRYLEVQGYPKTFELFVGKGAGDFRPAFEELDALQTGDTVTVYFDENFKTASDPINRLVYFIDRDGRAVFVKGRWEKWLALFLFLSALVLTGLLFLGRRRGRNT